MRGKTITVQTAEMSWPVRIDAFEPTEYQRQSLTLSRTAGPLGELHPRWNDQGFWEMVAEESAALEERAEKARAKAKAKREKEESSDGQT